MAWSVGIDLGGTNIAMGLVDDQYVIWDRMTEKTRAPRPAEEIVSNMARMIRTLLVRQQLSASDLRFIGIGLPGVVDSNTGVLLFAGNLELTHTDFPKLLAAHFPQVPILAGNDADCAIWGEYLAGEAKDYESALMLTLGTGIGGGLVMDHSIFRGGTGVGIEPGHIAIVDGGHRCSCGQTGCLEAYASIRGLKRLAADALRSDIPSSLRSLASFGTREIFEAVRRQDPLAQDILDRYVHYLALGILTFTVLYRPHVILLGGGISHAGEALLKPLRKAVLELTFAGHILPPPPVVISRLGNDAGMIGAAMLDRSVEAK